MSSLFSRSELRGMTLPNRIVVSPMCQYSAVDGLANDWHLTHLCNLSLSGAGALFIESTAVEAVGRITPADLGLWDDATASALEPVLATIRRFSKIGVVLQLAHAGRKASSAVPWRGGQLIAAEAGGWTPHAPSAVPQQSGEAPPIALDTDGIKRVIDAFAAAATRADELGVEGIELHAAHGYLMHEFLSPIANRRTDRYGGSLANRMRCPLEVFDAVRNVLPESKPLGVKISATDWMDGGWDLEQSIAFAAELKKRGVDWIDVSSGGISPLQKIAVGPGYQVPFSQAVREATGVKTFAVGLITDARQAEEIVASGKADFVALARAMLYDPRWPWHAAAELGATIDGAPPQYWRAPPHGQGQLFAHTTFGNR
jgi:2,4-dienoyl-CoA reductase-like NADH-dependent reductase (Old Yellow Enzyme family)